METKKIYYKAGYKYVLTEKAEFEICIKPIQSISSDYCFLDNQGKLAIFPGYAWDGPSGPAIDTKDFMRGSLVHDVIYQLIREKRLGMWARKLADKELYQLCREDGMIWVRAKYVLWAVRRFARKSAIIGRPILEAP